MLKEPFPFAWRLAIVALILALLTTGLLARIVYLGVFKRRFLEEQSSLRSVRAVSDSSYRGVIRDRTGHALAISVPVGSIWINPQIFELKQLPILAKLLKLNLKKVKKDLKLRDKRSFVYLKRAVDLDTVKEVMKMRIPGVFVERGYQRYYPEGKNVAHVVGFTNVDDRGQEGMELAYDEWLRGIPGKIKVVKDRLGHRIATLEELSPAQRGKDLVLSIDRRLQNLAFNELANALNKYRADSGSIVLLSAKTGEVLAMVNLPSYDPQNRKRVDIAALRNRAVTDQFEPGSTVKPFTVVNALMVGAVKPETVIDTNPGVLTIDHHQIYDNGRRNNGRLTVSEVLQKSSDIGVVKMSLATPEDSLLKIFTVCGLGERTGSGFPGEVKGFVPRRVKGRKFVLATLSFGYGLTVTALQLARAYTVFARHGELLPVSLIKRTSEEVYGEVVLSPAICDKVLKMLEEVVRFGTGKRAQIRGYRVAGKTGTAHLASPHGGYYKDRYCVSFVGIAPVSKPELIMAVVIKNPRGKFHHGSDVAAPVFAAVMRSALNILGIELDDVDKK